MDDKMTEMQTPLLRCTTLVSEDNNSDVLPKIFTPDSNCRKCPSEESLQSEDSVFQGFTFGCWFKYEFPLQEVIPIPSMQKLVCRKRHSRSYLCNAALQLLMELCAQRLESFERYIRAGDVCTGMSQNVSVNGQPEA